MTLSDSISLLLLAFLSVATLRQIILAERATRRQALLTDDVAGCCESVGFVGCSIICTGVSEMGQIRDLLSEEYDRYEVVVVLDSTLQSEAFREIVAHFRMIRVNDTQTGELPSASIAALYRSRQRSFRRLILIDRRASTPYDDLDAALSVASYGYIFPIGHNTRLCPRAIESVVITLAEPANSGVEMLHSVASGSCIFQREAIIRRGGFSPRMLRRTTPFRRICTHLPLTFHTDDGEGKGGISAAAPHVYDLCSLGEVPDRYKTVGKMLQYNPVRVGNGSEIEAFVGLGQDDGKTVKEVCLFFVKIFIKRILSEYVIKLFLKYLF